MIVISAIWYLLAKNAQKAKGINVDYRLQGDPARVASDADQSE